MNNKKVYYCVVGEQKCATTWLYKNLYDHPELFFLSKQKYSLAVSKEIRLFDENGLRTHIFKKLNPKKKIGDFTPEYLCQSDIYPEILYEHNPKMKIIIMLRHPLDRAISQYKMQRNFDDEQYKILNKMNFADALLNDYPLDNRSIKKRTKYYTNIYAFKKYFNIHIIFLEDIKDDPKKVIYNVCKFLNIVPLLNNNVNKTVFPIKRHKNDTEKIIIEKNDYEKIKIIINEEIELLEKLLNKNLSHYKL